jgi:hypothetical protein
MLVQLHTQNPTDPTQTEFLMQGVVDSDEDNAEWLKLCEDKWLRSSETRPKGWRPMVCTETSEHFMLAANPPK